MLPIRTSISAGLRHYPFYAGYDAIGLSRLLALFADREHYACGLFARRLELRL